VVEILDERRRVCQLLSLLLSIPGVTRHPLVNYLLFALAALLLAIGLRRAYAQNSLYRGRISVPILTGLSAAVLGVFCFTVLVESRRLPASNRAPRVGQKAPLFFIAGHKRKAGVWRTC
jgi:hypothetical protein